MCLGGWSEEGCVCMCVFMCMYVCVHLEDGGMWGGTWGISDNGDEAIKKKLEKKR